MIPVVKILKMYPLFRTGTLIRSLLFTILEKKKKEIKGFASIPSVNHLGEVAGQEALGPLGKTVTRPPAPGAVVAAEIPFTKGGAHQSGPIDPPESNDFH